MSTNLHHAIRSFPAGLTCDPGALVGMCQLPHVCWRRRGHVCRLDLQRVLLQVFFNDVQVHVKTRRGRRAAPGPPVRVQPDLGDISHLTDTQSRFPIITSSDVQQQCSLTTHIDAFCGGHRFPYRPGATVRAFMVRVFAEMSCEDGVHPCLTGKFMQVFAASPITSNIQITVACGAAAFLTNNHKKEKKTSFMHSSHCRHGHKGSVLKHFFTQALSRINIILGMCSPMADVMKILKNNQTSAQNSLFPFLPTYFPENTKTVSQIKTQHCRGVRREK